MDYYIIFHDGSVLAVGNDVGGPLVAKKVTPDFVLDGALYKGSSVSAILPQAKYFERYPEKRPPEASKFNAEDAQPMTPEEHQRSMNSLKRALKAWIDTAEARGEVVMNARFIFDQISRGRAGTVTENKGYFQRVFDKYKDRHDMNQSEREHFEYAKGKLTEMNVFAWSRR